MKTAHTNGFLTTSLVVNVVLTSWLIWQWGTGGVIIPLRPLARTFLTLFPYALALATIYVGTVAWLYLLFVFVGERWPATRGLVSWLAPSAVSKRFVLVYVLTSLLLTGLAVPYVSSRAHLIRSIVGELGFAGQGLALFGTVASIYGFLALIIATDERSDANA